MKVNRERYQHGSVRKVPRSQGFAREFRFYITAPDGKRKLKVQTFDSAKFSQLYVDCVYQRVQCV